MPSTLKLDKGKTMKNVISPETQKALEDKGITVTRKVSASSDEHGKKETAPMTTPVTTTGFKLPTSPAARAAGEAAFNRNILALPGQVKQYVADFAACLATEAVNAAQETLNMIVQVCDVDPEIIPDSKEFIGGQAAQFAHVARMTFLGALASERVPDAALPSVVDVMLAHALEWSILEKVGEDAEIGVRVRGAWYAPAKEYREEVLAANFLRNLEEKARGANSFMRDERKDDAADLRGMGTVKTMSKLLSLTAEELADPANTREVAIVGADGGTRVVHAATYFMWVQRQVGIRENKANDEKTRYVTHKGGVVVMVYPSTRTWKDKTTDEKKSHAGLFMSVMPLGGGTVAVMDGEPYVKPDDDKGVSHVVYQNLSEVLKPLTMPFTQKGHRLPPRGLPMQALDQAARDAWKLEMPFPVFGDEFQDLVALRRVLVWGIKTSLQNEASRDAYATQKAAYEAKASVPFADFFAGVLKAGTSYAYTKVWKDGKGKVHHDVHFLASRVVAGGDIVLAECPDACKALLSNPDEFRKVLKQLGKVAKNAGTGNVIATADAQEVAEESVAPKAKTKGKKKLVVDTSVAEATA